MFGKYIKNVSIVHWQFDSTLHIRFFATNFVLVRVFFVYIQSESCILLDDLNEPFTISSRRWIIIELLIWFLHFVRNGLAHTYTPHAPPSHWNCTDFQSEKSKRKTKRANAQLLNLLFTIHLNLRLITCKTVIWWMSNVFNMPLFDTHKHFRPATRIQTHTHTHHPQSYARYHSIFTLYISSIDIWCAYWFTQSSKHINWNDIMHCIFAHFTESVSQPTSHFKSSSDHNYRFYLNACVRVFFYHLCIKHNREKKTGLWKTATKSFILLIIVINSSINLVTKKCAFTNQLCSIYT